MFGNDNLSNLKGTLLEGNTDYLLSQARSDLAKRELHVESLNKCIGDLQKRTEAQNRALQDVQNEFVESRREQTRFQEELLRKEKALQDTQIRSKHEMGKMKRAQVQQFDEFSMQKLRENHETIQLLTSQLQQMQEQMNSIRGHVGSSHFLFERARCFSRSRAFLVLSCPSVCNPVVVS